MVSIYGSLTSGLSPGHTRMGRPVTAFSGISYLCSSTIVRTSLRSATGSHIKAGTFFRAIGS